MHLALFPVRRRGRRPVLSRWAALLEVRAVVTKALEEARAAKRDRLQPGGARRRCAAPAAAARARCGPTRRSGPSFPGNLANLFIVSEVALAEVGASWRARVERARGQKCERCWTYSENVGTLRRASRRLRAVRGGAGRRWRSSGEGARAGGRSTSGSARVVVALDQATKALVDRLMAPAREPRDRDRRPRAPHLRAEPRRRLRHPLRRRPALPVVAVLGGQPARPGRDRASTPGACPRRAGCPRRRWP